MIVFNDLLTGVEIFSDSFRHKLVDGLYYEVEGKLVYRSDEGVDAYIGANASAEGGDEAENADVSGKQVIDVVDNHNLELIDRPKKSDYKAYLKQYMKLSKEKIMANKDLNEESYQKYCADLTKVVIKKILPNWSNFDVYIGQGYEMTKCTYVLCDYREDGVTPYFIVFKDQVVETKH
ncbi:translationally-controlled tumor protein homolog [Tubulanus polymorphus]|uniref:translationally-controlled tumor protein homolog n=1 Tax=Tubulanus polymorphus TaxID=672921 RepID=UPI003DA53D35